MKKLLCFMLLNSAITLSNAQIVLSLDSCRSMALNNNKELQIAKEKMTVSENNRKAAFTNYLPELKATAGYIRNQREISILNDDQKAKLSNMGTMLQGGVQQTMQQIIAAHPDLAQIIAPLAGIDLATPLNAAGESVKDAFRTDTRNMFAGALTLTQPIFMGGKIRAYNKITGYAEKLAQSQYNTNQQEVILNTDQAYWQVVSLAYKKQLAQSFLDLVQLLDGNVQKMIEEGVATKADGLTVKVKVNEAEMTLSKVEDGLTLSKMVLCQLCGMDLEAPITLVDENQATFEALNDAPAANAFETALANRPELQSLELAKSIYKEKVNIVLAEHLPSVALIGNYMVTNPSVYNGFEKKFKGNWNVGAMVSLPIFHWGEGTYKIRAARAEANIAQLQLDEAREKIELQVNQSRLKVDEAAKRLAKAEKHLEQADENLRYANLGFEEGVIATNNVLEAQTAWLAAQSDVIDAKIEVKLANVYLQKSMGVLK